MCGIYFIDQKTITEMEKLVCEIDNRLKENHWNRDIHPTDGAPVITRGQFGLKLSCQRWGYPGPEQKGVIFNARSETVLEKRMFWNGIRNHRAVIPASCFYEWNKNKEKNTFFRADQNPLFLAGFYDVKENEERFVILTTAANDSMANVHNRMPLVLEKDQMSEWVLSEKSIEKIFRQKPTELERRSSYEQLCLF